MPVGMVVHAPTNRFIPLIRWNAKKQAITDSMEPEFDLDSPKIPPPVERLEDLVNENFNLRTDFESMTLRIVRTQVLEVQLNRYHSRLKTSFVQNVLF